MTKEQINRAIAESLGWREFRVSEPWEFTDPPEEPRVDCGFNLQGRPMPIPDWCSSLDACVEFEKTITDHASQDEYVSLLASDLYQNCDGIPTRQDEAWVCCVSTAPQRCEAYLRTIGKWVD